MAYEINYVQHELLHLWRTFFVCRIFLGGTLLCLRFIPLFIWGCMPYEICSVTWLVQCNSHIIHVVPIMIYRLAYCEFLFLSLVGLVVCICSRTIQICMHRLIGGD